MALGRRSSREAVPEAIAGVALAPPHSVGEYCYHARHSTACSRDLSPVRHPRRCAFRRPLARSAPLIPLAAPRASPPTARTSCCGLVALPHAFSLPRSPYERHAVTSAGVVRLSTGNIGIAPCRPLSSPRSPLATPTPRTAPCPSHSPSFPYSSPPPRPPLPPPPPLPFPAVTALTAIAAAWGRNLTALNQTWVAGKECSTWFGLSCNAMGQVTSLVITGQRSLGGQSIPAAVTQLQALQTLALDHNLLTGPIPDDISFLTALTNVYAAAAEPPCHRAAMPPCRHAAVSPCCCVAMLLCRHAAVSPCCCVAIPSCSHAIVPPCCRSMLTAVTVAVPRAHATQHTHALVAPRSPHFLRPASRPSSSSTLASPRLASPRPSRLASLCPTGCCKSASPLRFHPPPPHSLSCLLRHSPAFPFSWLRMSPALAQVAEWQSAQRLHPHGHQSPCQPPIPVRLASPFLALPRPSSPFPAPRPSALGPRPLLVTLRLDLSLACPSVPPTRPALLSARPHPPRLPLRMSLASNCSADYGYPYLGNTTNAALSALSPRSPRALPALSPRSSRTLSALSPRSPRARLCFFLSFLSHLSLHLISATALLPSPLRARLPCTIPSLPAMPPLSSHPFPPAAVSFAPPI
ncbi:unnamed protein product [Closterium sp. NIES-53]